VAFAFLMTERRSMAWHRIALMVLAGCASLASWGCTLAMRPVRLDAKPAEREALAGDWRGEYWMAAYDRHGTIAFKLVAAAEQATGDVLMISDRFGWPYVWMPPTTGLSSRPMEPTTPLLTIRFVRADRGMISGRMEPYWDPDRRCRASASFLGSLDGNVIKGNVVSVCEDDFRTLKRRWRVERKRASDGM
jgi:hypothetical protein